MNIFIIQPSSHSFDALITIRENPATQIGYEAVIDTSNGVSLTRDLVALAQKSYSIEEDSWYKVRLEAKGLELSLYIDDELLISTSARNSTTGYVEIGVGDDAIVYFDDFRIWSL